MASADANKRVKAINFNMLPALHDFDEYLYGSKANEKKDVLYNELLSKMQTYRPSGVCCEFEMPHKSTLVYSTFHCLSRSILDDFRVESSSEFATMRGHEK